MKVDKKVKIYGDGLEKGETWKRNMKIKLSVISEVSDLVCVDCSNQHDTISIIFTCIALGHSHG